MPERILANNIRLAYDDYGDGDTTLILLHGLTANLMSFEGLKEAGLGSDADNYRVVRVDLRGRGDSDKPETGYHMRDHAKDILDLMTALNIERATLVGHSFGGLLSVYLSAYHPDKFDKIVLLDVGLEATHPDTLPKIQPSLDRLGTTVPSWDEYINAIKASAYYTDTKWTPDINAYYRYDVERLDGGAVRSKVYADGIEEAVKHIIEDDWTEHFKAVNHPALLVYAPQPMAEGGAPILSEAGAEETVNLIPNCQSFPVSGHHITMVFGDHAPNVVGAIRAFVW